MGCFTIRSFALSTIYILTILSVHQGSSQAITDPTQGFVELPLNTSYYHIQKPWNLSVADRYSFIDGIHKLWVYSTDAPLSKGSLTRPRTEITISGYNYSSGVWQFEGYGYVPNGTTGVCIMQVFGAQFPRNTTLMLRVYNGSLCYYQNPLVAAIYDRWFQLNVVHDVAASQLEVYVDGALAYVAPGQGGTSHYFKCGVYTQDYPSYYMESNWQGIRVLTKM